MQFAVLKVEATVVAMMLERFWLGSASH